MSTTVRVVDDSPTARQMVSDTLRRAGLDTVLAVNGGGALARVAGQSVQLVITDFNTR